VEVCCHEREKTRVSSKESISIQKKKKGRKKNIDIGKIKQVTLAPETRKKTVSLKLQSSREKRRDRPRREAFRKRGEDHESFGAREMLLPERGGKGGRLSRGETRKGCWYTARNWHNDRWGRKLCLIKEEKASSPEGSCYIKGKGEKNSVSFTSKKEKRKLTRSDSTAGGGEANLVYIQFPGRSKRSLRERFHRKEKEGGRSSTCILKRRGTKLSALLGERESVFLYSLRGGIPVGRQNKNKDASW